MSVVLPTELWMQVFQDVSPKDALNQLTTCRLFHSLLEAKVYEDIEIRRNFTEIENPSASQAMKFLQTLKARPILFSLVRKLRLDRSDGYDIYDDEAKPKDTFWNNPVLWKLRCFSHLRSLELVGFHIDVACYIAIGSIPRLEYLGVELCDIDALLVDLQLFFRGNTISKLSIALPKDGDGWAALMTPGLRTFNMENTAHDVHMDKVLRGLLSCDLRRTLTKLYWSLDEEFDEDLCQFIEPCVQLESLSITYRLYPADDAEERSSHFEELSSGSLPMLSIFEGSAEYAAAIMAGRPVHSASLQLWDDTPEDVLLALQLSKVPVTRLELSQGDCNFGDENTSADTGLYLEHMPKTIEILTVHEMCDMEKLQAWIPDLSKLSHLQSIDCAVHSEALTQIEAVRLLSEACPSIREIFFHSYKYGHISLRNGNWVRQNDGSWEHYPWPVT